jgi:cell division protein ZapA
MATVNVTVNGRPYSVGCEDGQEQHVQTLARGFDRQVQEVGEQVGQVGDLRLFLMAALVTADELADVKTRLAQAQSQLAGHRAAEPVAPEPAAPDLRAIDALNAAAGRIEALTAAID